MTHQVFPNVSGFGSVRETPTTRAERIALGESLRATVPHAAFGEWSADPARFDPIALIAMSHDGRVADLVGIRVARMITSPVRVPARHRDRDGRGRGVRLPSTGIMPVVCGDAHLGNFGFYASPEGDLVIDLNDFDEAHPGAWEWDLRRLVASIWVAGRRERLVRATQCADAVRACVADVPGRGAATSPSSRC